MGMFADYALSQRLERAEAGANAAFVETRARLAPETGATWIEVAGTYAMFDAPDSPVTQTFGLGMFGEVTGHDLDLLEQFFFERNAAVHHEISPLAHTSVWPLISSRGYAPVEFTSLLFLELAAPPPPRHKSTLAARRHQSARSPPLPGQIRGPRTPRGNTVWPRC